MKKLGLLLIACFAFAAFASAQNNIVKSLERNVPGQGKVTIHQDARIEALMYRIGLLNGDYGYSTAVGLFNSIINVILLIAVNWIVKKLNDGEGL